MLELAGTAILQPLTKLCREVFFLFVKSRTIFQLENPENYDQINFLELMVFLVKYEKWWFTVLILLAAASWVQIRRVASCYIWIWYKDCLSLFQLSRAVIKFFSIKNFINIAKYSAVPLYCLINVDKNLLMSLTPL